MLEEVVKMISGIVESVLSFFMARHASRPFTLGILISLRTFALAGHPDSDRGGLPIPPPGHELDRKRNYIANSRPKKNPPLWEDAERKTGLEPATPTLARSCSTK